ncbi:MAG: glycosyltransferase family 4 protein [Thermoplasmata archaeon]
MRILQVSPFYYPHAGGVESHVRSLAGEFARQGHEVTILTSRYDRSLAVQEEKDGCHIVRVPSMGVAFNTPIDPAIQRIVGTIRTDIAHMHYPPPLTAYFAARGLTPRRTPTCLTYHADLFLRGAGGRMLTELYQRVFLPGTLNRVDRIIVHTRSYAMTSTMLRDRSLTIIPSVVDLDRFRPGIDGNEVRRMLGIEGKRILAFTGRLVPHKGLEVVLRALPDLPSDIVFLVIGSGPRLGDLVRLARRLNVTERVRFCPAVSDEDLPKYLSCADLFVFPSQNRLEGFGLAVAEAMAIGLPVLVADMPGVREVIEPGKEGLLAEPLLATDFAAKIRLLLDDTALRQRMGQAGRARAEERYGLGSIVQQLLTVYRDLIAAG